MVVQKFFGRNITFTHDSSTGNPDTHGQKTCDMVLWMKVDDSAWFRPRCNFFYDQIHGMFSLCSRESQFLLLLEALMSKEE